MTLESRSLTKKCFHMMAKHESVELSCSVTLDLVNRAFVALLSCKYACYGDRNT